MREDDSISGNEGHGDIRAGIGNDGIKGAGQIALAGAGPGNDQLDGGCGADDMVGADNLWGGNGMTS